MLQKSVCVCVCEEVCVCVCEEVCVCVCLYCLKMVSSSDIPPPALLWSTSVKLGKP